MLWLDATLATPLVGIVIHPKYANAVRFRDTLAPFCDSLLAEGVNFNLKAMKDDTFGLSIEASSGFSYSIAPENLTVRFRYMQALEREPGKFPAYKVEPNEPQPYSDLLKKTATEANRLLGAIVAGTGTQLVHRIGVMAFSQANTAHLPPGIARHLEHLKAPWNTDLDKCQMILLVPIGGEAGFKDRCHHHFQYLPLDKPGEMEVTLDWQRLFDEPAAAEARSAGNFRMIESACVDASRYFEQVGDGTLWH